MNKRVNEKKTEKAANLKPLSDGGELGLEMLDLLSRLTSLCPRGALQGRQLGYLGSQFRLGHQHALAFVAQLPQLVLESARKQENQNKE